MASVPTFDPNRYADANAEARRCRPIADAYEPGSTFKVITAAAAIEAGTIGPEDVIDCGGGSLTIGRTTIHEHGRAAWGALPLVDVLAHSSNVGAAHIGLGLGKAAFHRAVRAFGFGQKTRRRPRGRERRPPARPRLLERPLAPDDLLRAGDRRQRAAARARLRRHRERRHPPDALPRRRRSRGPARRPSAGRPPAGRARHLRADRRRDAPPPREGRRGGDRAARRPSRVHRRGEDGHGAEGDPRAPATRATATSRSFYGFLPADRPARRHRRPRRRAARGGPTAATSRRRSSRRSGPR